MAQRRLHDQYFKRAKAEGYVARSAYKLQEINDKKSLMRPGNRVLDLGCAPGAWLQVAAEVIGLRGVVVGIDLQEVRRNFGPNVRTIQGDVYKTDPADLLALGGGRFDVVLSDMAPNTTGAGDDYLSVRLCRRVMEMVPSLLRPGGNLAMKVFEGEEYPELLREVGAVFAKARGFKPKASRDVSREMYIVAHGYRGAEPAQPDAPPRTISS